jgi:hypothetical protein
VAGGALGSPPPGPEGTNDWLMRTFGNIRPGFGLAGSGGATPGGGRYGSEADAGWGDVGFGPAGSMESDLGQFLYDQASPNITGGGG